VLLYLSVALFVLLVVWVVAGRGAGVGLRVMQVFSHYNLKIASDLMLKALA
jgi:hypothetical protein